MIEKGAKAPAIKLTDETGKSVEFAQFKGKKVVVYFYPKDDTPGCTVEACGFRDNYDAILKKGAVVVGISADSEASHGKFKTKFDLPFYLLADPEKKAINAFGVWGEKTNYGKTYEGILRTTFIIDENGTISHVFPNVKPDGHAEQILKAL